jgi:predicted RND superfamily exporter protein
MESFARALIRFRVVILLAAVVGTALLAAALPQLEADDDVMQFLPQEDPELVLFNKVNARFGGLDVAIVGLEAETMFTVERLGKVRELTREIAAVDGVFDVMSFTEVPDPRPSPEGGLVVEPLVVEKLPSTEEELAVLEQRVLANENAVGNMISADGKAAMILCFLGGSRPPMHVAADIKEAAETTWTEDRLYFGGAPFIRLFVAGGTKEDMVRLTPVVVLVVLLVTFLIFRKPVGVLLALGTVGVALVWLMGVIALRGRGLTIVGSSLPTLLVAIGGAYGIHVLSAYFSGKAETVHERLVEAIKNVGAPVIASALTTCAGFLSFLAMDVAPMREFGLYAAIGVAMTGLFALTVIPAVLSFGRKVPRKLGTALLGKPLGKLGGWAVKNRGWTVIGTSVIALAGLIGVTRVAPDATLKTFFQEGSEPDEANRFLERHFGGSVYLQIYFEGDMRSPFVLSQLRKVVEHARGMDEVVQVNSIVDPLTMLSEAMGWRSDLPVSNRRTWALYPFLEGTAAIDQMIAPTKDASLVQIRLKDVGPDEVNAAVAELTEFVESEVPRGIRVVKIGEFADEEQLEDYRKYSEEELPEEERPPVRIDEPSTPVELAQRRAQLRAEVARRVARLAQIHHGAEIAPQQIQEVEKVLASPGASGDLTPGDDLDAALARVVDEYLYGDSAWFEPPFEEATEEARAEWERRGELTTAALKPLAGKLIRRGQMQQILGRALPHTSARDPEGLEGTASYLAVGLSEARAAARAERLVRPALAAVGVSSPPDELKAQAVGALSELDVPVHGFPETGDASSTMLARVTGMPVINVAFCNSTIRNQLRSLAVALVVVLLIMSVAFRSVTSALKGLVPALVMLSVSIGIMGAASIPLDPTTSMIAAIALGIGVDYAIHFLWRRRRRGESLEVTTAQVGPSIASNALQVACGFAVLALSDMIPMQRFGLLVAMTMVLAASATFLMLPGLRAEGAELSPASEARRVREGDEEAETATNPR